MQRARSIPEQGFNRRRHRSFVESKDSGPSLDLDTPEGLKARHKIAEQDIEDLKRKWRDEEEGGIAHVVAVIDAGDGGVVIGYSKQFLVTVGGTFDEVTGRLEIAGTTDTVSEVILNGYTVGTLTIPAGETSATVGIGRFVAAGDYWQIQQVTAGSGAIGPTYYGVFS